MSIEIRPLNQVEFTYAVSQGLDIVFFEASATRSFATEEERSAFRRRWLGNYLLRDSSCCFMALDATGAVVGYVVGSLSEPSGDPRFADLTYFRDFSSWTRQYPAHLHINVAPQYRSAGVGARLIEAFQRHAAAAGAPGVHVVTGEGLRNVGFYRRHGFAPVATAPWKSGRVVMLACRLGPAEN